MRRDKARDDKFFDHGADHEINYVSGLYDDHKRVREFLLKSSSNGTIKYLTHLQLYTLIEKELGYKLTD